MNGKPMKDVNQSPVSTGNKVKKEVYSPPKAIAYGLLISVVLASLVSMTESIIFAILTEPELGSESRSVAALSNTFLEFPVWYNISVFLTIIVALNFGARRRI
jgi:hypothetical protein